MRNQRGFSLIEVLVALTILAIVTLSIIGLFSESIRMNASGLDYTRINNMARDKLEALISLPYSSPGLTLDPDTTEKSFPDDQPAGSALQRTYTVREYALSDSGDPDTELSTPLVAGTGRIKEITVTVSSRRSFLVGRREVTVVGMKVDGLQ